MFAIALTVFVAWNANAANAADATGSTYCQQTFASVRVPAAKSDNRYALLLMFDASAKDTVHTFFHTAAADPAHGTPIQDGCIKDPDQPKETSKVAKPLGLIAQGSCPTDCVPPPPPRVKKTISAKEDPLGHDKWGIFSADDGSDTQILVWQILASEATHAGRILASLKQDSNFPTAAYRGHLVVGYHDPRSSHTPKSP
jgi:hypothetical protein